MKNSLKGAFLSGLIFPGLGQIALRHYQRGTVIIIAVLASLSIAVVKAVQYALAILEKIQFDGGAISMSTILEAAAQASTTSGSLTFNLALLLVILFWIIGTVDAYRIGKKIDIEEGLASYPECSAREGVKAEKINILEKFKKLPAGDYAVGLIAGMNDYEFKIVKFKGDFIWHSHPETDETFIILEGELIMNFRDRKVQVHAGEMIVVPKGVEHKPSSINGYKALLIEPEGVPNTGNVKNGITIKEVKRI